MPIVIKIIPVKKNTGIVFLMFIIGVHAGKIYWLKAYLNASFLSMRVYYSLIEIIYLIINKLSF